MRHTFALLSLLATLSLPTAAQQNPIFTLEEGDLILGAGGDIKNFSTLRVNDTGIVYSTVVTTNGDRNKDTALLLNGFLALVESSEVGNPPGAVIRSFLELAINRDGYVAWPLQLKTGSGGITSSNDRGLFWNTQFVRLEGDSPSTFEVAGVPISPNTVYTDFYEGHINDNNWILLYGQFDDPTKSQKEDAVVRFQIDQENGQVLSEEILLMKNYPFPGLDEDIKTIASVSFNNRNHYVARLEIGEDSVRNSVFVQDGEIIAREGDVVSFFPTRTWLNLTPVVDNNDFDDYLYIGQMSKIRDALNDNLVLVLNGELLARANTTHPAIAPARVDRFNSTKQFICNDGNVLWYVESLESASANEYFIRNDEVILKENTSTVQGEIITTFSTLSESFYASPSGRFMLAQTVRTNGNVVLVLIDFGTSYPLPGCGENLGTLDKVAGEPRVGEQLTLRLDNAQGTGVLTTLFWSLDSADGKKNAISTQCGFMHTVGELMLSLSASKFLTRQELGVYNGTPINKTINFPNDPNLVGLQLWTQGVFYDAAGSTGGPKFQLTNGFYIELGAPL